MDDIVKTLLPKIEADFRERIENNANMQRFAKLMREGKVKQRDAQAYMGTYATNLGENLGMTFKKYLTPENMPDETFYWNIVERIVQPMISELFGMVTDMSAQCQRVIDRANKLGIGTIKPQYPQERVKQICEGIADQTADYETIQRRMESPIVNIASSFNDDFIEANAAFRDEQGFVSYIERVAEPNCCKWCTEMAGKWKYGNEPDDVYRRHDNCNCTVTFYTEKKGYMQNAHTKVKKTYEPRTQLTRLTQADADAIDEMIKAKKKRA